MTEQKPEILRSFHFSNNIEADYLERYLGIKFPNKPNKVDLNDLRNRFLLFQNNQLKRNLSMKTSDFLSWRHYNAGSYLGYEINTFFIFWGVRGDSARQISLHENFHAYMTQTNPLFEKFNAHYGEAHIFSEGLAEWAALETWLRLNNPNASEDDFSEWHNVQLEYDERETGKIGQKHTYEKAEYSIIDRGHRFASDRIAELRGSGLSLPESIQHIIMNPPEEVDTILKAHWW